MANMSNSVLVRIVANKFNYPDGLAETVVRDLLKSDFPANDIRTMGEAIAYLDKVKAMMDEQRRAS